MKPARLSKTAFVMKEKQSKSGRSTGTQTVAETRKKKRANITPEE